MDLTTDYAGLKLENPIIIAPAGITGTVERMKEAEQAGAGAVVVKTLFEKEITRQAPTPRFKIIRYRTAREKTFSLYSYEQASILGPKEYALEIEKAKRELNIPLIASISCLTPEGWLSYAKLMEEAGADALELNLSCPHGPIMLSDRDMVGEMIKVTKTVKEVISIPVIPKLSPQLTNPLNVAKALEHAGAKGLTLFNRLTGLEIDIEQEEPIMHRGYAGYGGPWSRHYTLRWISAIYPQINVPLSGSGGVWSGEDIVRYILSGATTVQVCTAIIMQGYKVVEKYKDDLVAYMKRKGYQKPEEFRGKITSRIISFEKINRQHILSAEIEPALCNSCGLCERICIYKAVSKRAEKYRINGQCDGCGLCVELCPETAIRMVGERASCC